jgi:hypothetical protein
MTIFVIAAIVFTALSILSVVFGDRSYKPSAGVAFILGFIGCIISAVLWLFLAAFGVDWVSAQYKADIVNREYKTGYTQAEMFYASDVIDTVRELDRKRYEVNGDLMREQPEQAAEAQQK